jgi:hypothetical protein
MSLPWMLIKLKQHWVGLKTNMNMREKQMTSAMYMMMDIACSILFHFVTHGYVNIHFSIINVCLNFVHG